MNKREKLNIIRKYYPNAETTTDLVNKLVDYIENTLDMEPGLVMFADSIGDPFSSEIPELFL